jgi:putative membrane protein
MSNSNTRLNDQLALERTSMANERTFLAYIRTALALAAGGVALIELWQDAPAYVSGMTAILIATVVLIIGVWRYIAARRRLAEL